MNERQKNKIKAYELSLKLVNNNYRKPSMEEFIERAHKVYEFVFGNDEEYNEIESVEIVEKILTLELNAPITDARFIPCDKKGCANFSLLIERYLCNACDKYFYLDKEEHDPKKLYCPNCGS